MKKEINISFDRKYEQLRIFFDGSLHLHLKLIDLIGFQSWIHGSSEYYIEYTFTSGTKITSAYQDIERWKALLTILENQITVK